MNAEKEICTRLSDVFHDLLNDVEITGNMIESEDKGVDVYEGRRLNVNVSARRYEAYTSAIAEFTVTLDGVFAFAEDTTLADSIDFYDRIVSKLEAWQRDIALVKTDLSTETFVPVGLRLTGGNGLSIDENEKDRSVNLTFTVKGRMKTQQQSE